VCPIAVGRVGTAYRILAAACG